MMKALVVLLAIFPLGCASERLTVSVRDGDTGQPLDSGKVCATNYKFDPLDFTIARPSCDDIRGGEARVRWFKHRMWGLKITAPGYIPRPVPVGSLTDYMLFQLPEPTVVLVIPAGYRGLLKLGFDRSGTVQTQPAGTRTFEFVMKPEVVNRFVFPPILQLVECRSYKAMYDDGTPLPARDGSNDGQVQLRHVQLYEISNPEPPVEYFCVGTDADERDWRRKLQPPTP